MKINMLNKSSLEIFCLAVFFFMTLFGSIIFLPSISAAVLVNPNASSELNATICINDSYKTLEKLAVEGFATARINDSIRQAEQIFASQISLKTKGRYYDFLGVLTYCNEISTLADSAFNARDEISSLLKFYNDSISEEMNSSSIDKLISEIQSEMADERYEKISPLIDRTYSEIINVQSAYTSLNVFYQSTAKGIRAFLLAKNRLFQIKNWLVIVLTIILFVILYLIYRIKIQIMLLDRKIERLKIRKKTIKDLIMQTQKAYFQTGKISEGDYNVKVKKFAELVRDIDRQIPLLQEELIKLQRIKGQK